MGYPGKSRKSYESPRTPWDAQRLAEEAELIKAYGLRNKHEMWKAYSLLRGFRRRARDIMAMEAITGETPISKRETDALLSMLKRYGMIKEDAKLNDVLRMTVENIIERRLQTQVFRQGLARTIRQARQFVVHGHICIDGKRVTVPSYLVPLSEEMSISYYANSPLSESTHPERPVKAAEAE
ncbi:MAG: 30S ribosomal protein S4 [Methermicoccaceae archaeon]